MPIESLKTSKTVFTRMCIGEAIVALLKKQDLAHLRVLSVVQKAGVSRMTFYKYYATLQDALEDYLQIIISGYIEECKKEDDWESFLTYKHILSSLQFFDRYSDFFVTMHDQGLYSILIKSVNEFVDIHLTITKKLSAYKRYSYAGSLLNCFIIWQVNGKKESAEDVAMTLYQLYGTLSASEEEESTK